MTGAIARRAFDALESFLSREAVTHPRRAFALAAIAGALRNRMSRRWPSADEVRALLPNASASAIAAVDARNRVCARMLERFGLDPLRPFVRNDAAFEAIAPPAIFGLFHVGAIHALGAAVERLGAPVLALRHGKLYTPRSPHQSASTENRAAAFYRALRHLQRGGFVAIALDIIPAAEIEVRCLGRPFTLARGAFALSRMTGAPIIPLAGRWTRDGVDVIAGEPLPRSESEQELADAAAAWLERYLLDAPAELTLGLLRRLSESSSRNAE